MPACVSLLIPSAIGNGGGPPTVAAMAPRDLLKALGACRTLQGKRQSPQVSSRSLLYVLERFWLEPFTSTAEWAQATWLYCYAQSWALARFFCTSL